MSISRENFFRAEKNYIDLQLQQGVPLIDADWNENTEILRNEIYAGIGAGFSDGVQTGSDSLLVSAVIIDPATNVQAGNDFSIQAGTALIRGRPCTLQRNITYSAQLWIDPIIADRHGVAPIEPIETPTEDLTLLAYLDVWEREVNIDDLDQDDPERQILENRDIGLGIVTAVRLKREIAVRVIRVEPETPELPEAPDGHAYMPLALLNRIANNSRIAPRGRDDVRPMLWAPRGKRNISFSPVIQPISNESQWALTREPVQDGFVGLAANCFRFAVGFLPTSLPPGARLLTFNIWGRAGSEEDEDRLTIEFYRFPNETSISLVRPGLSITSSQHSLIDKEEIVTDDFNADFPVSSQFRRNIVDNENYFYGIYLTAMAASLISIYGISISYEY